MIFRNIFGDLGYKIGKFYVIKKADVNAKYYISKHELYCCTTAVMYPFWDVPVFDSFMQAACFLRDNFSDLI